MQTLRFPQPKVILQELNLFAKKGFSQNFFTSEEAALNLVRQFLGAQSQTETIWEIGPGLGALTYGLCALTQKKIFVFEKDERLFSFLRQHYPATLIEGDFLEASLESYHQPGKVSVISNLPYQISSPVLFRLLENSAWFECFLFMFQKEVAHRLLADPGTKDYGLLSVIFQNYFDLSSVGSFSPHFFSPSPSVDSEAVLFVNRNKDPQEIPLFLKIVKSAFAFRRKKLINNLKHQFPEDQLCQFFRHSDWDENVRAEELSPQQFEALNHFLASQTK